MAPASDEYRVGAEIRSLMGIPVPIEKDEVAELADAFDIGWTALRLEYDAQKADPSHPITRKNPFRSDGKDQQ